MDNCFNQIIYIDQLGSSNDYLINLYKEKKFFDPLTVYVNKQFSGRGRLGKTWYSGVNDGLCFSFSICLEESLQPFLIQTLVTISICKYLNLIQIDSFIKFPNDIYVEKQKIAGILCEKISANQKKYLIVGIGLNVNNIKYPKNLKNAISIAQLLGKQFNKKKVFNDLISKIKETMALYYLSNSEIDKIYMSHLHGTKDYVICFYEQKKIKIKIIEIRQNNVLIAVDLNGQIHHLKGSKIKFILN
tara:strand:- start:3510 stop:4244 length:735 start_codon:yes stop_codon:yes gene_type:complete